MAPGPKTSAGRAAERTPRAPRQARAGPAAFVVKATPRPLAVGQRTRFDEKTMWDGKTIAAGDPIFIFASDHEGGQGLIARGVVASAAKGEGSRVYIDVEVRALAKGALGRRELKPYCELANGTPQCELARHFYRQATNKIAGISDAAKEWLETFF